MKTENMRYNDIYSATIDDMGQKLFDQFYKNTGKRWLDIARVWDRVYSCQKHFVLTSVVHKIFWGVYPYEPSSKAFAKLLKLIEKELLRNGEAFQAWCKWRTFRNILDRVVDSLASFGKSNIEIHYLQHYFYLKDKTLYEIMYSKTRPDDLDDYLQNVESYERAVKQLVPASENWSRRQWGNDMVLSRSVKKLYGIDYSKSFEGQRNFDRIICLLDEWYKWGLSAHSIWYVTNITEMSWKMAQHIWPENTENQLADILIEAHQLLIGYEEAGQPFKEDKGLYFDYCDHLEREAYRSSWLFNCVTDLFNQGRYTGKRYKALRKVIFDLQICGCTVSGR